MLATLLSLPQPTLLLLISSIIIIYAIITPFFDPLRHIPGPFLARYTRLWYLYKIYRGDFERTNIELHRQYGAIVRIAPGEYSIDDVDAAKVIYGHGNNFVKAPWYGAWMSPDPNQATLFADTNPHRHSIQRRKFASAYSMSSLVNYEPYVDHNIAIFITRFRGLAKSGRTINFAHWFQCYAFDVIGEITFGKRFGFLDEGIDKEGVFDAVDAKTSYATFVGIFPALHRFLFKLIPSKGSFTYIANFTKSQIATRVALYKDPDGMEDREGPPDFVSRFLAVNAKEPEKMTAWDILSICLSNIGAGSDTTAITISSVLYHLLRHPATFKKLRKEIDDGAARGIVSNPITFKDANELPYLQAVIKEALRLHPATGLPLARLTPSPGATIAGHHFPAGTTVGINAWVAHQNTSVFGSDASEWRPERWLDFQREGRGADVEKYFFAFGMGSRTCIGKNLSLLEVCKLVPELVRGFEFVVEGGVDGEWRCVSRWFVKPVRFCGRVLERGEKSV